MNSIITDPPRRLRAGAIWSALWSSPLSLIVGLWTCLFPCLFVIPLVFGLSHAFPHQADFKKVVSEGAAASATVTRIDTVENMTINDEHPRRVHFDYKVGNESRQGTMDTMSIDQISEWQTGKEIQIRYLGTDAVIPALEPIDFPFYLFYFIPFFLALVGVPFLLYSAFSARRVLRVLKDGVVQDATLLSLTPIAAFGGMGFLLKTRFEAIYSFTTPQGQTVVSKSQTTDLLILNEKKKGDAIEILVVPDRHDWTQIIDGATLPFISYQ